MGNSPLPQSIENECAAIGSAILDPKAASYLAKTLTPDDFYRPANRDVFRAVLDLCRSGTEIDLPQLAARMEVSGSLGRAGGVDYLVELFESVPSAVMVDCYADIVKDRSVKRSAIELLHNAERSAYGDVSALELLDGAIGGLMTLRQTNGGNSGSVGDFVDGALDPVADSINFGVRPLDRIIGGLEPGTLHIIGAKPGTGKTQLLVASMISMGECGVPCGAISAEMEGGQMGRRFVVQSAGLNLQRVRCGNLSADEVKRGKKSQSHIKSLPLRMDDTPGASASYVQSQAREWKTTHGIKALFIDYLQLMSSKEQDEVGKVTENVRGLKQVARELGIVVVCLAQLNREGASGRPSVHHLKGSSEIEQTANSITLMHRNDSRVELIVGKNRDGETGTAEVCFDGGTGRFTETGGF